jgi:hypothetical protein
MAEHKLAAIARRSLKQRNLEPSVETSAGGCETRDAATDDEQAVYVVRGL